MFEQSILQRTILWVSKKVIKEKTGLKTIKVIQYKLYRITYTTGRTAKSSSSPGWVYLCGHIVSVMLFHSPNQEIESIIPDHYGFY